MIHDGCVRRWSTARLKSQGLDRAAIEATHARRAAAVPSLSRPAGEQAAQRGFRRALPFIYGLLLFMGVMTGGQTLMTSTIEEKSSRVVEVLLAAVSPLELMWGKLLGQLGVGLIMMGVYVGLGIVGLFQFAMVGVLDPCSSSIWSCSSSSPIWSSER